MTQPNPATLIEHLLRTGDAARRDGDQTLAAIALTGAGALYELACYKPGRARALATRVDHALENAGIDDAYTEAFQRLADPAPWFAALRAEAGEE